MRLSASRRRHLLSLPVVAVAAIGALTATSASADTAALEWKHSELAGLGDQALSGVEVIADDDVWAVGATEANDRGEAVAIHWNGEKWEDTEPPAGASLREVAAVDGEVWAVGVKDSGNGLTTRWNGKAWDAVEAPKPELPAGQKPYLTSVDGAVADDVWAVGSSRGSNFPGESTAFMQHWDGEEWSLEDVPLPGGAAYSSLHAVRVFAADDAWAVGQTLDAEGVMSPLLLHWNGDAWSPRELSIPESSINDITLTEDGRLWLAGAVFAGSDPFEGTPLLAVGDGENWTRLDVPSDSRWLASITPNGSGGVVAVGMAAGEFLAVSSDGGTVTKEPIPSIDPGVDHASLEDVGLVPGTTTLWTVGFTGKYEKPVAAYTV